MANTKNIQSKLQSVQLETAKIVAELNKLKTAGTDANKIYAQMSGKIKAMFDQISKTSESVKKSFAQTKNQEQYIANLKAISTEFGKIERVQNKVLKGTAAEEAKVLKKQQNLRNKIAAQNKERTKKVGDFETKNAKRRAKVLKTIEDRKQREAKAMQAAIAKRREAQRREDLRSFKLNERKKTAALKAESKKRAAEEKKAAKAAADEARKKDFGGGFRSQLTPRSIGGALGSLTKYLGLYKLLAGAGTVFNKVIVDSTKKAIEFEKELANLGAVAGVGEKGINLLRESALDAAGATTFTASEIVGMQVALSKLGFEAEQTAVATKSIAFTAQALGESLDVTATLVGKVINQFGLLAEETGEVADILVTTINNSALSLNTFGTAIQYVGPLATELGFDLKATSAAMAVLADNGFTASRVGTGLRAIFTELGKTTADVRLEIEELAKRNLSLSEAVDLVGKRNAAQLLTLVRNVDVLKESNKEYYEQGRAMESSAKQIDTVSGQLQLLSSRYNEVQIGIGEAILKTGLFERAIRFLSPAVARTVQGFKAFREVGTGVFNQGTEAIADGANASFVAIDQLASTAGPLQDYFERLAYQVKSGGVVVDKFGNVLADVDLLESLPVEVLDRWQGYVDLLEEGTVLEKQRRAAAAGRAAVDDIYKTDLEDLNLLQRDGVDITTKANALAAEATKELDEYNNKLKENKDLSNEDRITTQAQVEQTQIYLNKLTNLLGVQKNLNDERKTGIEQRKFELDQYEAEIEALDDQYARLKLLAELRGDEISGGSALLVINKAKVDLYDELLSRLAATKTAVEAERDATDQSTDAGRAKVKVHQKEIEALDKLLEKYEEQRSKLTENLGVMESIFSQGEKDLKAAASSESSIDIKIDEQNNIIDRLEVQLLEAAGDDVQLQEIARAYIGSLFVSMGEEVDEKGDDLGKQLLDKQKDLALEIAQRTADAARDYNATALANKQNALKAELAEIANKYKIEEEILKSSLNNQLITESQYRVKQQELQKKQVQEENQINEAKFNSEKKADSANAIIDTLEAIASNAIQNYDKYDTLTATGLTAAGYATIVASGALKLDSIRRRKFYPVKFEDGGMVDGPSHSQGGVPFSVQGQSGYEMEGGEFIVNKKASSMHRELLESINRSVKPSATIQPMKFATGGVVTNNVSNTRDMSKESVNYLKAIANATLSTANDIKRPTRAFVSSRDLSRNETERRLAERNDRI